VSVSLDLGLSRSAVRVEKDVVTLPDGQLISRDNLSAAFSAPEDCIEIAQGACEKIYVFDHQAGKYYKLFQPFEDRAPTLVINNATMHAIVRMDPWQDEQEKVSALSPRGGECLDTCFGLGYSAQLLVRAGCEHVVSCEADPNVLGCAAANPWSRGAFGDPRIEILQADVREYLRRRQEGSFAAIFHDPPTIHQAGELYAAELYAEFARVLASGGVLYHYVGAPGARLGRDLTRGVMRRLHDAGFVSVRRVARGVLARRKWGRLRPEQR
jgi:hypothetical protein